MRRRTLLLPVVAVLSWATLARAQAVKSPADLFPAKVLAYAEVRQPGRLAQEIRSLFQGSVLGNVPESLAKLHAKYGSIPRYRMEEVGIFGLMLAPEVAAEIQRVKGAAIALTGVDKHGQPEFVAVVLPGGSHAPSFLMRIAQIMAPMRPIGKVEGVTLYQPVVRWARKGQPEETRAVGPAVAMMPGVLMIGSPEAVKDTIRRAKKKGEGDTLAESKTFQEALEEAGKEPGLFAFADVQGLVKLVEAHVGKREREVFAALTRLINPKAFRAAAYSLTLSKGTFRYREIGLLNPKEKSPILDLIPTTPVNTELLHFAPRDALFLFALSNDGGGKRWTQLLELADQMVKLGGHHKNLPSDVVKQLEAKLGIDLGKDVIDKISQVEFAVGDPLKAVVKKGAKEERNAKRGPTGPEIPMVLVLQATDKKAAKKLADLLPHVAGAMARVKDLKPTTREINGHTIHTLKPGRGEGLHYGRLGNVLVLGPYPGAVARALESGKAKKGWLANPKSAASIKDLKDPVALVVFKPMTAAMGMFLFMARSKPSEGPRAVPAVPRKTEQGPPVKEKPPAKEKPPQAGAKPDAARPKDASSGRGKEGNQAMQAMQELSKLLALEEPIVISVTRKEDRMVAEGKMSGLKPLVARLTDFAVEQMYRSFAMRGRKFEQPKPRVEERKEEKK